MLVISRFTLFVEEKLQRVQTEHKTLQNELETLSAQTSASVEPAQGGWPVMGPGFSHSCQMLHLSLLKRKYMCILHKCWETWRYTQQIRLLSESKTSFIFSSVPWKKEIYLFQGKLVLCHVALRKWLHNCGDLSALLTHEMFLSECMHLNASCIYSLSIWPGNINTDPEMHNLTPNIILPCLRPGTDDDKLKAFKFLHLLMLSASIL